MNETTDNPTTAPPTGETPGAAMPPPKGQETTPGPRADLGTAAGPPAPERAAKVAQWLLAGARESELAGAALKDGWTLTAADVAGARAVIVADFDGLDYRRALTLGRLNAIYAVAMRLQDVRTAAAAQQQITDLSRRWYPPAGTDHEPSEAQSAD